MTTVRAATGDLAGTTADVVVVGIGQGPDRTPLLAGGAAAADDVLGGTLLATLASLGATGAHGELTRIPTGGALAAPVLLALGLGKPVDGGYPAEALRRAAGALGRALAGTGTAVTTLAAAGDDPSAALTAVAEGVLLGAYSFSSYRHTSLAARKPALTELVLLVDDEAAAAPLVERAVVVTDAVALARDLVNTPPLDLHPAELARRAAEAGEAAGLSVEVLDEEALAAGGYGGILGVGAGSARPPRLVRLTWTPPAVTASTPRVALVGKGITFDSGGISIKPAANMENMKSDMAGAASVIAAAIAAARLGLPVIVDAWAPLAENMPGGQAIRPSDVLTMFSGTTVEVINTDAEGRLVLADALARAAQESPVLMVDVATLTGAQLVALGTKTAAVMGTDDARAKVVAAASRSGELVWPMPLPPELRPGIDSETADILNTGPREGGMLTAGLFLQEFVPDGVAWAHLDVAGPAYNTGGAWGHTPKGGTGHPVRTLVALLEDVAAGG